MIDKELEKLSTSHPADTNGDGRVSKEEEKMYLEFKRKELEVVLNKHQLYLVIWQLHILFQLQQ